MPDSPAESACPPGPNDLRGPGVLVVDDEEGVREVLDRGLQRYGFRVWLAASGPEALEVYRRHGAVIGAVLLDVRMPEMDGPQTLAALRRLDPAVPCCFMSGQTGAYTEEDLHAAGAAAFVRKPFQLADVAQVLHQLLGGVQ